MNRRPPRSTRTDTLVPYTTLFRSVLMMTGTSDDYGRPTGRNVTMYEDQYGLSGRPFALTPDPRFWFETATHRKAMAYPGYRSEEHTSELQSLMRISYAVFCLKKKKKLSNTTHHQLTNHITTR